MSNTLPAGRRSLIPWLFVAGLGVVVAANTALIVAATRSATGLVVSHPYERGIAYNRELEREKSQALLDWRVDVQFAANGRITATASSRGGDAIDDLAVTATFQRPVEGKTLAPVALFAEGNGRYGARIELPQRGQWEVTVRAERDGIRSETVKRWVVP